MNKGMLGFPPGLDGEPKRFFLVTSKGSFVVPDDCFTLRVRLRAGGGGGGGGGGGYNGGGAGGAGGAGAGGTEAEYTLRVQPGEAVDYEVGVGGGPGNGSPSGSPGANGGAGGITRFGGVSVPGGNPGSGGAAGTSGPPGAPGAAGAGGATLYALVDYMRHAIKQLVVHCWYSGESQNVYLDGTAFGFGNGGAGGAGGSSSGGTDGAAGAAGAAGGIIVECL